MGLRMKNLNILGVHWKIRLSRKIDIEGSIASKKKKGGGLDSLQI